LIAVAAVLIVNHNLTANIDGTLSQWLTSMAAQRSQPQGGFHSPPTEKPFQAPVLYWTFHPDGNYADSSSEAKSNNLILPVSPTSIQGAQTIVISGNSFRVMGGRTGDDWTVVAQTMTSVDQARTNLILAELLIGPVLLIVVFLGALAIGRRVAAPVEQARRRQMDFTANASHELRTPLSVIQAQSSLALAQPRSSEWYQRAFQQVNRESQRMRHLVDELLWLARFEAAPGSSRSEPVDVGVMTEQAVDRFAAVAESRQQQLTLQLVGQGHAIAASPEWLDHLVGVLLDNACKYTPARGHIEVKVRGDGHRVTLAIDDSGPGIPAERRADIFERFQRASDQPGGAGLGLAIADAVVRATNGRWKVGTSTAGGASLAVSWPQLHAGLEASESTGSVTPPVASPAS
jgi:signal transduction histidine kinase